MRRATRTGLVTVAVLVYLAVAADRWSEGQAQSVSPAPTSAPSKVEGRALIDQYCMSCHSDRMKSGGLALSQLNLDDVQQSAEIAEKVIRKLRGGLMPPAGARRPDSHAAAEFVSWLENKIDAGAARRKNGRGERGRPQPPPE